MAGNCKKTPCLTSEDTAWKKRKTIRTLPSFATVTQQINQPGKNPYKPMTRKSSAPCSGMPAKSTTITTPSQVLGDALIPASTLPVISNSKEGEMCQKSGDNCSKIVCKRS
jgi:hypothetical protein